MWAVSKNTVRLTYFLFGSRPRGDKVALKRKFRWLFESKVEKEVTIPCVCQSVCMQSSWTQMFWYHWICLALTFIPNTRVLIIPAHL